MSKENPQTSAQDHVRGGSKGRARASSVGVMPPGVEADACFRAMFDQPHIGIVQVDKDGRLLNVNPGACALGGYDREELLGMHVADVTHPDDLPKEEALSRKLFAGELPDYALEKRFVRKDGSVIWGRMTATLVRNDAGAPLYILAIVEAVGERIQAEEKLRDTSLVLERQTRVFDITLSSMVDFAYIFDREGRFAFANQALADLLQMNPAEIVGKNFAELGYPAELAAKLQRQIQEVFETKQIVRDETAFVSPDGATGHYEYIFRPVAKGEGAVESVVGTTRDVTERKGVESALRGSEERFRLLVEGARDYAMFLLDPDRRITFWSRGAERVFGWTADEAVGQTGAIIFTPEDRANDAFEIEIGVALREGRIPDRRFHLRKDGSRFWADGVLMRLDGEGGVLRGFAKVARDASDQRRVEDELRHARDEMEQRVLERTADLMATNKELERTMKQRAELERELLLISEREKRRIGEDLHDMVCQELTATALLLQSAAKKVEAKNAEAAATLSESAQLVNRNVGLARDLARGLQPAELKGAGLKDALRALAAQACENGEMKCHFKAARGVRVTDDSIALSLYRVAQEAVNNAVKHSGAKNILISLDKNEENVCVSVQDDGKGFSPKRRSKGLGLHIMRYRANALGGKLKMERRKRGGMEITCVFPVKR